MGYISLLYEEVVGTFKIVVSLKTVSVVLQLKLNRGQRSEPPEISFGEQMCELFA
jgi:hypothetical protein